MNFSLKLRGKLLLIMLLLAAVPLIASLLYLSNFTQDQIRSGMAQYAAKSSAFVEQSNRNTRDELVNYLALFSGTSDLVNAVYYANLTGDPEQVVDFLAKSQARYDLDIMEVRDPQGEVLARATREDLQLAEESNQTPLLETAIETGEPQSELTSYLDKLTILVIAPIRLQDQVVGYLLGASLLDDIFANDLKQLTGVEVAFLTGEKVLGASHPGFRDPTLLQKLADEKTSISLGGNDYVPLLKPLGSTQNRLVMAFDMSSEQRALQSLRQLMSVLILAVVGIVLVAALAFSRYLTRPLLAMVANLREISQGDADLTRTLQVGSADEVGDLADNFNRFVARLREMVLRLRGTAGEVNQATDQIRQTSQRVSDGANQQAEALEDSFQFIQGIDESATEVASSISTLLEAVEISSSATLELGATIEEIVSQVDRLFGTIEGVTSSIAEMSVSSQEVSDNLENLSSSTEVTASSITEMDASIKEVEETAKKTNELSEKARVDAEQGKTAVANTIAGIQTIRATVEQAAQAITELGKQSGEIGTILTVIDEVADQTRLLSLNASIIAAQAGEHGKGFAVVADEIRELAERTASSTQEIASIIKRLQSGTGEAVKAMQAGNDRVIEEAERSKVAEQALDKLTESSIKSAEQVKSIVRATQEQSRGSRQITEAVNQVANMLQQISTAVKQQSIGIQQLAEAAESMKDIASQVKLSTSEQAKGSHQINDNMERVRSMLQQIDQASKEQSERSQQVVETVAAVRKVAESNAARTQELDRVVESLTEQARSLDHEIGSFKA
ncbi:MAG: methyl-accepting chemotaxis protein [Desulfuromonadales bacterium]|nr:methyl-accepting chemotaxis protein [Desulfuromonadales bacterium]